MKSGIGKCAVVVGGLVAMAQTAGAQPADWVFECGNIFDANARIFSDPYLLNAVSNDLATFAIGFSGTATIGGKTTGGGQLGCFENATTIANQGKFAISVGPVGSIQKSSANFDDDFMTITIGAPFAPMWCNAVTTVNGTITPFPAGGYADFYFGSSNRYLIASATQGTVFANLQIELVADATRLRWTLTNNGNDAQNIGLMWGAAIGMLTDNGATSGNGAQLAHWQVGTNTGRFTTPGYIYIPGRRLPEINQVIDRDSAPSEFPDYVDIVFSQEDSFGIRLENTASPDTDDPSHPENQPTDADQISLGNNVLMMGAINVAKSSLPGGMIPDTRYLGNTAFIQRFPEESVPAGESRQVLFYIRNNWGVGSYSLPYGALVDAPKLIQARGTDFAGNPSIEDLVPNPFKVRVWFDNVGGFGYVGNEIALQDVRCKITFPAGSGVTVIGSNQKTLNSVPARELRFLDFDFKVDGDAVGDIPWTVHIESQPGNVKKDITGSIRIAGRPRTVLRPDANLLGVPYTFNDTSWSNILSPFMDPEVPGGDVQVFEYDPRQQGYIVSTSARRGLGAFVIYDKTGSGPERKSYGGSPEMPNPNSTPLLQVLRGWNLIANPYNYNIYLHQFIGVPDDPNNQRSMTWQEMVDLNIISNYAAYFDAETDQYEFVDGTTGVLEPNKGYWIYVNGSDEVSLSFPPLYEEFVPGATRAPVLKPQAWEQTDKKWRLNLVARTSTAIDSQNYVGAAATAKDAALNTMYEPPMFPNQEMALFVEGVKDGKPMRIAQAISERSNDLQWKIVADVRKAGEVTLTWPNLGQVPKNLRFRLIDVATGTSRDLRQVSGYTFRADKPGTREFRLDVTPGNESRAIIGNVVVSRPTRDRNAPFTITYTLSGDATTSVRVLSAAGREVFAVSRGRADRAGENTVVWALRDSANRAVAPGTYRVEIIAETSSGERVRKVVPINVVR